LTTENFFDKINKTGFIEDSETKYNNQSAGVYYKQLPIVINSDILVKVVLITQGDGFILTMPEDVYETFKALEEDESLLADKNINLALYAEVFNFDTNDPELHEFIKEIYLAAGNSKKAFDFVPSKKTTSKKDDESEEQDRQLGAEDLFTSEPESSFDEIETDLEDLPEIEANLESYTKFKKYTKRLDNFKNILYNNSDNVIRNNVKYKYIGENESVLTMEVDNKNVYELLSNSPKIAKNTLSRFGESIRLNKKIQLLDSFNKEGKRYFVLAENAGNNYWLVKGEKLDKFEGDDPYYQPIQEEIIKLSRSSVRFESRHLKPYKVGRKIVYRGENLYEGKKSKE